MLRRDIYQLLVLAIACHLPRDEAYSILNMDFIERFSTWYDNIPMSADKLTVVDAMIKFTVLELPMIEEIGGDVKYTLSSQRSSIVDMMLNSSTAEMTTKLASRSAVSDMIRSFLAKKNIQKNMYSKLNSSRVTEVISDFLADFREHCAYAYQFVGTFQSFVMNCFINFYYKGHKRDIWATLRRADAVKRAVEQNIVEEKIIDAKKTDDVLIHDLVLNINLLNHALFYHSGQSIDAHGVCYDTYYLILCLLCEKRVSDINSALGSDIVEFIDPQDRREARLGVKANKGVAAKIENAKELIPHVFEYVRAGRLNTSDLVELRDQCFRLGKHDREGRNCPWKDVVKDGETSRYLDTMVAAANYTTFDLLVKGVVSASTLMSELESRGYFLVNSYRVDLFNDTNIVRYIDYLSSVQYIDLMRELQAEPVDYDRYGKDLLEFPGMVDEYAGSAVNNHTNIRDNRYYAITRGFLDKPRLKQATVITTRYDRLRALSRCMDSIPRSWKDYLLSMDSNRRVQFLGSTFLDVVDRDVVEGSYTSLYTNIFIVDRPDVASYYLMGDGTHSVKELLDRLDWRVGTSLYATVRLGGVPGLYIHMRGEFMFCAPEQMEPTLASLADVIKEYRASGGVLQLEGGKSILSSCLSSKIMNELSASLSKSIGFGFEVGIANLASVGVKSRIEKMSLIPMDRKYMEEYFSILDEMSLLQHSFIQVLEVITTEVVYWLHTAKNDSRKIQEYRKAAALLTGLQTGEFDSEALEWVLRNIHDIDVLTGISFDANSSNQYPPVDRTVLDYCFGSSSEFKFKSVAKICKAADGPAERFALLYNYVNTSLEFLRYLRDAYSLAIDVTGTDASTLTCELTQRFELDKTLRDYLEANIKVGVRTSKQDYNYVRHFVWSVRDDYLQRFRTLVDELVSYIRGCEQEIAKLVEYNISARKDLSSRFEEIGQAFNMLPAYPETPQLLELKSKASMDSSGFFMLGGSYFKGRNGSIEYYVHRSGRMVMEDNDEFYTAEFNIDTSPEDMKTYQDILNSGLGHYAS